MKTLLVACRTLADEIAAAMKKTGTAFPVYYLDSGLHNTPKKLTAKLQELLDSLPEADTVLLGMGYCGNALAGLRTGDYTLVIPRVDDCITLLIGSVQERQRLSRELSAYYFTPGWLRGERNMIVEYEHAVKKYGKALAADIMDMMYSHYRTLALLDTGISPMEELEAATADIAGKLRLTQRRVPATLRYIEALLRGERDEEAFLVIPPHTEITAAMLTLPGGAAAAIQ